MALTSKILSSMVKEQCKVPSRSKTRTLRSPKTFFAEAVGSSSRSGLVDSGTGGLESCEIRVRDDVERM